MGKWDVDIIRVGAFAGFFGAVALVVLRAGFLLLRLLSEPALLRVP